MTKFTLHKRLAQWALVGLTAVVLGGCTAQQSGTAAQGTSAPLATTAPQTGGAPATSAESTPASAAPQATSAPQVGVQANQPSPGQSGASSTATPAGQVLGMQSVPPCVPGAALTPAQTEGPYYRANPPQRSSLADPGMAGTRLTLSGYVVTSDCKPVPGARVDLWQADDQGRYDNSGYRLRGYVLADERGRYTIETIVPGLYPGRTRHIHVKVGAANGSTLTSQLYFPNEPANARDSIYNPKLVMDIQDVGTGKAGTFNFVIPGA